MDIFANDFELKKPPLIILRIKNAQFAEELYPMFESFLAQDVDQEEFSQLAALLSRLMARRKNSFRKMKGFKAICKLNAALCRLLRVDLPRIVENFFSTLPGMVIDQKTKTDVPTRNSFDYVLVRIISVHQIHQRIRLLSAEAGEYISKMLKTNFFLETNTLLLAVIAKIRHKSMLLENKYAKFYNKVYQFRLCFPQNENNEFLPQDVELLESLSVIAPTEECTKSDEQTTKLIVTKSTNLLVSKQIKQQTDLGTAICRETLKPVFDVGKLDTIPKIRHFITEEYASRESSPSRCRTKAILNHEWKGAVRVFEAKVPANQKKAIFMFQQFLNSKLR